MSFLEWIIHNIYSNVEFWETINKFSVKCDIHGPSTRIYGCLLWNWRINSLRGGLLNVPKTFQTVNIQRRLLNVAKTFETVNIRRGLLNVVKTFEIVNIRRDLLNAAKRFEIVKIRPGWLNVAIECLRLSHFFLMMRHHKPHAEPILFIWRVQFFIRSICFLFVEIFYYCFQGVPCGTAQNLFI